MKEEIWKEIETAPKDGSKIILFSDEGTIEGVWGGKGWKPIVLACHGCGCCEGALPNFTHWMPLVKPPTNNSE